MRFSRHSFSLRPQFETMEARTVLSTISVRAEAHAHAMAVAEARHEKLVAEREAAVAHAEALRAAAVHAATAHPVVATVAIHSQTNASATTQPAQAAPAVSTSVHAPISAIATTKPAATTSTHATTTATTVSAPATTTSTTTNVGDVQNGPLAKGGQNLVNLYVAYESYVQGGSSGTFTSSESTYIYIEGTSVKVDVRGTVSATALASQLTNMGMQVSGTDAASGTVEGFLPISQLVAVAQLSQVVSLSPVYKPALGMGMM